MAEADDELLLEPMQGSVSIPAVRAGPLHRLIQWLTFREFTGQRFLDTFLLMYRTFKDDETGEVRPRRVVCAVWWSLNISGCS